MAKCPTFEQMASIFLRISRIAGDKAFDLLSFKSHKVMAASVANQKRASGNIALNRAGTVLFIWLCINGRLRFQVVAPYDLDARTISAINEYLVQETAWDWMSTAG